MRMQRLTSAQLRALEPGLPDLFGEAMECFEYFELSCSSPTTFQTCSLMLDIIRLRLLRWGEAMDLSYNSEDAQSIQQNKFMKEAGEVLKQIPDLFQKARKKSARYGRLDSIDNAAGNLDALGHLLHEEIRKLCINDQSASTLHAKSRGFICEGKYFHRLLEDIAELLDKLVKLSPTIKKEQLRIRSSDFSNIDNTALRELQRIEQEMDKNHLKAADFGSVVSNIETCNMQELIVRSTVNRALPS
jgi:hypothetical protein